MHDVCAGYIVNDWGDVKLDKFVDDPMTASNVRRPRAVGAANKKVRFINTAVDYKKGKGSPYSITERRVPELIPVLGSQPAGDMSHKRDGGLPLLSARPAVTLATVKSAATSFAAWRTEAQWV